MDITTLTQIVSSVGFPIAACFALGWYIYKIQIKTNDIIQKNTEVLNELAILIREFITRNDDNNSF